MHVDYAFKFKAMGGNRLVVLADFFNLFNLQRTTGYDNFIELEKGVTNPDFGAPVSEIGRWAAVPGAEADSDWSEVRILSGGSRRGGFMG
jgi:hypothetical protein